MTEAQALPTADELYQNQARMNFSKRLQNATDEANHWQTQFEVAQFMLNQANSRVSELSDENENLKIAVDELKKLAGIYGPELPENLA